MWLDRTLLLGPRFAMVTSEKEHRKVLREIDVLDDTDPFCDPNWQACVHAYDVAGEVVCVVGVNLARLQALEPIDAAAALVHEAVHVWQRTRAALGPGDLGTEMEAYAIENISAALMRAYVRATSSSAAAPACGF